MENGYVQRRRSLTDEDIEAIAYMIRQENCVCSFTANEIAGIKSVLDLLKETKSTFIKGIVGAVVVIILTLLHYGIKFWSKQ